MLLLSKKLVLSILVTIPILMVVGGMRTPNFANLNELRPHIHHCALFETSHKVSENQKKKFLHELKYNWCSDFQTPRTLRLVTLQVTLLFKTAAITTFPPRAPPFTQA